MRKIVLLSFDDGTIYDERFVALLNQYRIPCTFNLNSGLEDFVWYYEDRHPIRRLRLSQAAAQGLYRGHEVASHSVSHPCLTALSEEELAWQVGEDCRVLGALFGVEQPGFAVPFTACGEREVELLKPMVKYIRLSEYGEGFGLPRDPYHIYVNGLYNDPDLREKISAFSQSSLPVSLFVLCGHSYELEVLGHWTYLEELLQYLRSFPDFEFMTTAQFVDTVLKV